jgi:hypothetical protein
MVFGICNLAIRRTKDIEHFGCNFQKKLENYPGDSNLSLFGMFPKVALGGIIKRLPKDICLAAMLETIGVAFQVPSATLALTYMDGQDMRVSQIHRPTLQIHYPIIQVVVLFLTSPCFHATNADATNADLSI